MADKPEKWDIDPRNIPVPTHGDHCFCETCSSKVLDTVFPEFLEFLGVDDKLLEVDDN